MCLKMVKEKSFKLFLITYGKNKINQFVCELRGTHQNSGHPHQNNILAMIDMLLEFKWAFTSKY